MSYIDGVGTSNLVTNTVPIDNNYKILRLTDYYTINDRKPKKLTYSRDYDNAFVPRRGQFVVQTYNGQNNVEINALRGTLEFALTDTKRIGDGSKSFIAVYCRALHEDNTNIEVADKITLAPRASHAVFEALSVTINQTQLNPASGTRQDVIRTLMKELTSDNGARKAGCYGNEQVWEDKTLNKLTVNEDDPYFNTITDGKEFALIRPLDDLPCHGQLDPAIPPQSIINYNFQGCNSSSRMFRYSAAPEEGFKKPKLIVTRLELWMYTDELNSVAAKEIIDLKSDPNTPFLYVTDRWEYNQIGGGNIIKGQTVYNPNIQVVIPFVPDVGYICLFPASTFTNVSDSYVQDSVYKRTWGNVKNVSILAGGRTIKTYRDLDLPGKRNIVYQSIVNTLSGKQDSFPLRGFSPYDINQFMNGAVAMIPIDLRYVSSEDLQLNDDLNVGFSVSMDFASGGASEDLVPVIITKSKACYEITTTNQWNLYNPNILSMSHYNL